jgi:hypothetical protein
MRYGDVESRGDCLWRTLRIENLPGPLQTTLLASEACRWVMILSWIGQIVLCFRRGEYEPLIQVRATA